MGILLDLYKKRFNTTRMISKIDENTNISNKALFRFEKGNFTQHSGKPLWKCLKERK